MPIVQEIAESLHSKPATRAGIDGHPSTQRAPCGANGNTRTQRSSNIMLRIPHVSTHARDRAAACYHGCPAMVSAGIKTKGSRARNQGNKKETRAVKTCAARLRRVHLGTRTLQHANTTLFLQKVCFVCNMFVRMILRTLSSCSNGFPSRGLAPGHARTRTRTPGS